MRRLVTAALLAALAGTGLLAAEAAAQDSASRVHEGWRARPRCAPCGDTPRLTLVQFAGERTGWLAGGFGVARTDDGGATWQRATGLPGAVSRASFHGDRGVAVGDFEGVAVSGDGGRTWRRFRPIPGKVFDVQALPDRLLAVTSSVLYTSTDGGLVWKRTGTFAGGGSGLSRVHFADATHGTVATADAVATTHDGGRTWAGGPVARSYPDLRMGVFTADASTAYAVGLRGKGPSEHVLERTTDGATFGPVEVPDGISVYRGLVDVAFQGATGYAVGWEGVLLRSTDAGATWTAETPPSSFERTTFHGVAMLSPDRAVAVTYGGGIVERNGRVDNAVDHPLRTVGVGLLGLAGLALAGAGTRVVVARPDVVAAGLAGLGIVAGAGGGWAYTTEDTKPAESVLAVAEPPGAGILDALTSPVPVVTPSKTASPTPAPDGTPTPSVLPNITQTPAPTQPPATRTTAPPASRPPSSKPATPPPTTSKPAGRFTVTPANVVQQCGPNHDLPSFDVTLKNTTSAAVPWRLEFVEQPGGDPWAGAQHQNGTLAAGASFTVTVYPNGPAVCGGLNGPTDFHLRVRRDTSANTLLATVTDRISPP